MARTTAAQKAAAVAVVAESLGVDPDALAALIAQKPVAEAKAKTETAKPAKTFAESLDEGVAAAGFTFARGRVYLSKGLIETAARALNGRSDSFTVVQASKSGAHTAAVVVVKDGDKVYAQNLTTV